MDSPDSEMVFYLMLRTVDRFFQLHSRYPGTTVLWNLFKTFITLTWSPTTTELELVIYFVWRYYPYGHSHLLPSIGKEKEDFRLVELNICLVLGVCMPFSFLFFVVFFNERSV